jgi:hypothetical protein
MVVNLMLPARIFKKLEADPFLYPKIRSNLIFKESEQDTNCMDFGF